MIYDYYCPECNLEETKWQTLAEHEASEPPACPAGHGPMLRDLSKSTRVFNGYLQEKGKYPYFDIQTDQTYHSRREHQEDLSRRGLRPREPETISDRNRELLHHRKVFR